MELSDSITSVTTSYAKLRKLSKKCSHLVCQAEQTRNICLVPGCSELGGSIEGIVFCGDDIFR